MPFNQNAIQTTRQMEQLDGALLALVSGGSLSSLPPPPPFAAPTDSDRLIPFPD